MSEPPPRVLSASNAPIFFSFFTWGFGTGAQNLGRPLFALAVTGNVFLVGVLIAVNAIPRFFTGPLTGYLTDRLGRKPLIMLGPAIRGATNFGQVFADDYVTFLVLEVIGQIGVAMWATSSNVLLSDVTTTANRGRVLALRQMSMRLGFVAGPLVGGVLAAVYGLPALFLLNGISKVVIVLTVLFLVKETRPRAASTPALAAPSGEPRPRRAFSLRPFRDRAFVALAFASAGGAVAQAGVMQTLIPAHARLSIGADETAVGFLISLAALAAFLAAFPNGIIMDRFGRKVSLVPALALLGAASFLLGIGDAYVVLALVVVVQGVGGSMAMTGTHAYAMDLAPADGRGAFLGMVMAAQSVGAIAGPAIAGALYEFVSPLSAFVAIGVLLVTSAVLMAALGRETAGPRRVVVEGELAE
ncbi:MAG: MFS transporter [Chloroflexi bacterium]|nr:MFS transporter [Chloroflexota bacterium]